LGLSFCADKCTTEAVGYLLQACTLFFCPGMSSRIAAPLNNCVQMHLHTHARAHTNTNTHIHNTQGCGAAACDSVRPTLAAARPTLLPPTTSQTYSRIHFAGQVGVVFCSTEAHCLPPLLLRTYILHVSLASVQASTYTHTYIHTHTYTHIHIHTQGSQRPAAFCKQGSSCCYRSSPFAVHVPGIQRNPKPTAAAERGQWQPKEQQPLPCIQIWKQSNPGFCRSPFPSRGSTLVCQ